MTSEERGAYIRSVIVAVYDKQPEEARIPPYEWGIVNSWMEKGVPLATVLQTVDQMEKHPSIRYVRQAVEDEEFRRRRALA